MTEKLTFGELCEAIIAGKEVEFYLVDEWVGSEMRIFTSLESTYRSFTSNTYRIKPEPVKRYQWICKHRDSINAFWMLGGEYRVFTSSEAVQHLKEYNLNSRLVEPYLPSEASE